MDCADRPLGLMTTSTRTISRKNGGWARSKKENACFNNGSYK